MKSFTDPTAFRRSLEDRLRADALTTGTALDRLRKEAAGQRLLARLEDVLPKGSWALKGGLALVARLDTKARATKDIDATWRDEVAVLDDLVHDAIETDLNDFFAFDFIETTSIEAEGPEGGIRYRILARLDGREFERLQLDVNLIPSDPRPVETVQLRNPFEFAEIPALTTPVISVGQHLAEKLHAYTRSYGTQVNSRSKDLYDMLAIVDQLNLPDLTTFQQACTDTFQLRDTPWPPQLKEPPQEWEKAWAQFVHAYEISWTTLDEAFAALSSFWAPVLAHTDADMQWHAEEWRWK